MSSVCRRLQNIFSTHTTATSSVLSTRELKLQKMADKFKKSSESPKFRFRHERYSNIVRRLAAAHKFSLVEDVLEYQKKFEDIRNEQFTIRLITLYGKAGMFDHAHELFDQMPDLNCVRTVRSFNALLSACIGAGKFDKVQSILQDLPPKLGVTLDVVSFNTVIKAYCKMGNLDSAVLVLDEMQSKGVEPDLITFNTLLNVFYGNGKFADGERIWGLMESKNVVPNTRSYNSRLRGLVLNSRVKEAVKLLGEMEGKGCKPDVMSYNAVIKGFCDDGNAEEVKRWYKELRDKNCLPDRVTYVTIVPFLCQKGDFEMALELCTEVINTGLIVGAGLFKPVIDGLVKQSKIEEAKNLVELGKSNKHCHYKLRLPLDK